MGNHPSFSEHPTDFRTPIPSPLPSLSFQGFRDDPMLWGWAIMRESGAAHGPSAKVLEVLLRRVLVRLRWLWNIDGKKLE
jgi:hypothetical protein